MKKVVEVLKRYTLGDADAYGVLQVEDERSLRELDEEGIELWAKQLGIKKGSKEFKRLKELVERLKEEQEENE